MPSSRFLIACQCELPPYSVPPMASDIQFVRTRRFRSFSRFNGLRLRVQRSGTAFTRCPQRKASPEGGGAGSRVTCLISKARLAKFDRLAQESSGVESSSARGA